jgi:hypothetical protein
MRLSIEHTVRLVFGAAALAGCGSAYLYTEISTPPRPAKADNCPIEVLLQPPARPYEELGVLAPKDIEFDSTSGGASSFRDSVRAHACRAGGDAVVAERNWAGNYARGTVIKFK